MARLYSNENFPLPVVEELRRLGHDVLTTQDTGEAGRAKSDDAILGFASDAGRAVLTLNRRHFVRLHGERPDHAGIVVSSVDLDSAALAERIHRAMEANAPLAGKLVRVNRPSS